MKRIVLFTIVLLLGSVCATFAQKTLKIGHVNMDSVAMLMPEVDSMRTEIEARRAIHARTLRIEEENFNNLYLSYTSNMEGMPQAWIEAKQDELIQKQQAIENLKRIEFPNQLQEIQERYLQMMYDKIMDIVKIIAKEKNYTYILNSGEGLSGVLYAAPSEDLTGVVIERLNLDPDNPPKMR